jgi:hypothetical protein
MSNCEFLDKCLFFNDKLEDMPKASDMMKKMYCRWNYTTCARYMVATALGKSAIPHDMFPGDNRRANEMLIQYDMK